MGAEPEVSAGGRSPCQSEGEGAAFPGGIKTPQPQDHCAQHRAAAADRGGCIPVLPAAFSKAETLAAEAAAAKEAGPARHGQAPRPPFISGQR